MVVVWVSRSATSKSEWFYTDYILLSILSNEHILYVPLTVIELLWKLLLMFIFQFHYCLHCSVRNGWHWRTWSWLGALRNQHWRRASKLPNWLHPCGWGYHPKSYGLSDIYTASWRPTKGVLGPWTTPDLLLYVQGTSSLSPLWEIGWQPSRNTCVSCSLWGLIFTYVQFY